jgi:hypothetical protein
LRGRRSVKKVAVFNPLNRDFHFKYDINNDRKPVLFTIHSREVEWYDPHLAKHAKKHLANLIFDEQFSYRKDRDMQMKEIYKMMEFKP